MKKKTVEQRALEYMAEEFLTLKFKDVQMTMYEGKWERMIEDCVSHFVKLAKKELKGKP